MKNRSRIRIYVASIVAVGLCIVSIAIIAFCMRYIREIEVPENTSSLSSNFIFDIPTGVFFGMKEGDLRHTLGDDFEEYDPLIYRIENLEFSTVPTELPYSMHSFISSYGFSNNNQLEYIAYSFFNIEDNPYDDAIRLIDYIKSFKGDPSEPLSIMWTNNKYKDDVNSLNRAFRDGHCTAECQWNMGEYVMTICINDKCEIIYSI